MRQHSFTVHELDTGRCAGRYLVPQYHIFDLAGQKYLTKDGTPDVVQIEWAGVFDPVELDAFLLRRYGTCDRFRVAFRATLILVK